MLLSEQNKEKIIFLIRSICGTTIGVDIPTDYTVNFACELLSLCGCEKVFEIVEIPLCWENSVCIRFTLDDNEKLLFNLYASIEENNVELGLCVEYDEEINSIKIRPGQYEEGTYLFRCEI